MKNRWMWLYLCATLACGEGERQVSTVTVSGKVKRDGLTFTSGVKVEAVYSDGTLTSDEATSDSAGSYAIVVPARSELYLRCSSSGCIATNSQFLTTGESAVAGVDLWVLSFEERTRVASGVASATGKMADLPSKGFVIGVLYDDGGYAVTGAKVSISTGDTDTGLAYADPDGFYDTLPFTIGLILTHQFGAVNVPVGEFELTQDVDGTSARARSVAGEATTIILEGLPSYCGVIGTVVDEDSAPVAGATVEALDESGALLGQSVSDDKGVFALNGLTEGMEFCLRSTLTGYAASNTRYYELGGEPLLAVGVPLVSTTYRDLVLTEMESDIPGFTRDALKGLLAAQLTDGTGALVLGETFSMSPASGDAGYLDASGSFETGAVLHMDTLNVGSGPQWVAGNVDPGTVVLGQSVDGGTVKLPCRADEVTYVGVEKLPIRVRIKGTVRDEADNVVQGADVLVYGTLITAVTDASGRFQLAGRILAGSTVTLQIALTNYRTTNTRYVELPNTDLQMGDILLMSDVYLSSLVSAIESANTGLTVDASGKGFIAGAVRDLQLPLTSGPGKVDGATVSVSPTSGLLDYLNDVSEFGNTETDDQAPDPVMFFAVNVDPGDVTLTEDWDSTGLDCPVRAGEVSLASFRKLTPQNTIGGLVLNRGKLGDWLADATVDVYDEAGELLGSTMSDASGVWRLERLRAFKRLYVSVSTVGYVTSNTQYFDVEYSDALINPCVYSATFRDQLLDKWDDVYPVPDTSSCGVVMGDLVIGIAKAAGLTASLRGCSEEVGYLDASGDFGVISSTDASPQLAGDVAPQFHIFDVTPGDYVLEQSGDGEVRRLPVRAGEYTYVGVLGIVQTPVTVTGTVMDGTDPVGGATVRILDSAYSTVTAPDGTYTLSSIPARSTVSLSVSKDGQTMNMPYQRLTGAATQTVDLFSFDPRVLDFLAERFEAELGALDAENKARVLGGVQRSGAPVEGVTVALSPSAGDTAYFDQYLRAIGSSTLSSGLQFLIGNVEPGDAVLTQDANWQRVELPCRAGEITLSSVDLTN